MSATSSRYFGAIAVALLLVLMVSSAAANKLNVTKAKMDRCNDFKINHVDAITLLKNGSLMLFIDDMYWVLPAHDYPLKETGKKVADILKSDGEHFVLDHLIEEMIELPNKTEEFSVDAAVHLGMEAINGKCVPADYLILYKYVRH